MYLFYILVSLKEKIHGSYAILELKLLKLSKNKIFQKDVHMTRKLAGLSR